MEIKKIKIKKIKNGSFMNNLIKSKKKINLSFCDKFFFIIRYLKNLYNLLNLFFYLINYYFEIIFLFYNFY